MKLLIVSALLATTVLAEPDYVSMFKQFKVSHLKSYASETENAKRFNIFVDNMRKAAFFQSSNPHATFGVNKFADLSAAEFKSRHNAERHFRAAMRQPRNDALNTADMRIAAGDKIDWRTLGAVTPVKDQEQCGACWAFAATGSIEGQWFLAGNTLTSLSEQELVSCDTIDSGCFGGVMENAFTWLIQNRGGSIVTEASLPYTSGAGIVAACPSNLHTLPIGATISGYNTIASTEDAMAAYCYSKGPIATAVDSTSWQTYTSGILSNCISQYLDHGVLIVGYDDTNVPPYWIIKNSWGASWGESGYIRIAKGSNQCLLTEFPTSSVVYGGTTTIPTTTAPTTTPAPSSNGALVQKVCTDSACSVGCQSNSFPLNTCLTLSGGGSAILVCGTGKVIINEYVTSGCSGFSISEELPTNQCQMQTDGLYLENICSSAVAVVETPATIRRARQ